MQQQSNLLYRGLVSIALAGGLLGCTALSSVEQVTPQPASASSIAVALPNPTANPQATAPTWSEFISPDKAFAILMPGKPNEEQQQLKTAAGQVDLYVFSFEQAGIGTYLVSYADYPTAAVQQGPDATLEGARDGIVSSVQGVLQHEQRMALGKHPGLGMQVDIPDGGFLNARLYLIDRRLYQVFVITKNKDAASKDMSRYLDSFRLLEQ